LRDKSFPNDERERPLACPPGPMPPSTRRINIQNPNQNESHEKNDKMIHRLSIYVIWQDRQPVCFLQQRNTTLHITLSQFPAAYYFAYGSARADTSQSPRKRKVDGRRSGFSCKDQKLFTSLDNLVANNNFRDLALCKAFAVVY
jgi:hypothetical protein